MNIKDVVLNLDSVFNSLGANKTLELSKIKGSYVWLLAKCLSIHCKAQNNPCKLNNGLIGVGLISYADHRLERYIRLINYKIKRGN